MSQKRYPFTIIPEKESEKDDYGSQSHDRIANSILENIKKSTESFSLGLEGNYGIGKSTIIKILTNKVEERSEAIRLFKFDAWTHEGDPLRKVFLKSFINFLGFDDSTKDDLINKHVSKKPKTEKHITRSPTLFGIVFTFSTTLLPVALVLSRKINIYYTLLNFFNEIHWYDRSIILMLFGPIIVGIINLIYLCLTHKSINDLKNWSFIYNTGNEHIIEIDHNKTDKNSLEFEESLIEIIEVYFLNTKNKLVIVIDNLDRTQNRDGLKLFNTIHSIIDNSRNSKAQAKEFLEKLYIIIPYDYLHLKNTLEVNLSDYLDKALKLRMSVPRPVFSDWKLDSEKKIKEAFNSWPPNDVDSIIRIYHRSITRPDHSFSPRQLILFINQVGLLRNHFDSDKIDSEVISFYVIHRYLLGISINVLIKGLIENNFPSKNDSPFLNSTDIKGQLASILYDTTIEDAYVILIADELTAALYDNDEEKLKILYEHHKNHFDRVFYNQIKEANAEFLIQASTTIINTFKNNSLIDLYAFKKELSSYFNSNNEFRGFWDEKTEDGFIASVNFACTDPIDDFWERMIKKDFLDKMPGTEKEGFIEQQSQTFSKISYIYHRINEGIITRRISLKRYVSDYSALARLDYKAELNLINIFDFSETIVRDFELGFNSDRNGNVKINPNIYYLAGFIEKHNLNKHLSISDDRILQLIRADLFNKDIDKKGIMYFLNSREVNNTPLSGSHDFSKQMNKDTSNDEVIEYIAIMMLSQPKYFANGTHSLESNWVGFHWSKNNSEVFVIKVYQIIEKYNLYQKFWDLIINYEYKLSFLILGIMIREGDLKLDEISNLNEEAFETLLVKIKKYDSGLHDVFIALLKALIQNGEFKNIDKKLRQDILANY